MSDELESIVTPVPGPRSRALAGKLRVYESQNVTYVGDDAPIFWKSAQGANITDVDGNRFIDFSAAFGVAAVGHANPAVTSAIAAQAQLLPHAMGDVHPGESRPQLLERLAAIVPIDAPKTFLASTGAEAVEFALKTAMLATGEPDVLAFGGAYHGLSYGALEVCGIPAFRRPWNSQLRGTTLFAAFPDLRTPGSLDRTLSSIEKALRRSRSIAAVIVEPIQGRAGYLVPPYGFLSGLSKLCKEHATLLIVDEIYTGFGRTGAMFACEHEDVRPDIICIGKALGGGFPISAAVGTSDVIDAWPPSHGEALHTSTFLGNPMGCAAALAVLEQIESQGLVSRAVAIGERIADAFSGLGKGEGILHARGRGAMQAIECKTGERAREIVARALRAGLIVLQAGLRGEVVTLSPPLVITDEQLDRGLEILAVAIA